MRRIMILAVALGIIPGLAFAQNEAPTTAAAPPQGQGAVNDQLFVMAVAESDMAEIAAAKTALQRAGSDQVKTYARQIIEDHTQSSQMLMNLAAAKGITLPRVVGLQYQAEADALNGLQGDEFDKCYAKQQVATHMCAIGLFKAESERGSDPDIRAFAAKTLPKLKHHLQMARQLPGAHERDGTAASRDAAK